MGSDKKFEGMDVHHSPKKEGVFVSVSAFGSTMNVYSVDKALNKTPIGQISRDDLIDAGKGNRRVKAFKTTVMNLFATNVRVTDICISPDVRKILAY